MVDRIIAMQVPDGFASVVAESALREGPTAHKSCSPSPNAVGSRIEV
jgi:hypothetical protein